MAMFRNRNGSEDDDTVALRNRKNIGYTDLHIRILNDELMRDESQIYRVSKKVLTYL